jgi:Acyl carrier protein
MPDDLINQLKTMLIEGLRLEDIMPDDLSPDAPLFSGGLGLDSIDALEIGVMLDRQYGIKITSGDERNTKSLYPCGRWQNSSRPIAPAKYGQTH